ncbi:hypothetical protein MCP1_10266 [Candidatus Terasakiella magnetica]|nr:hypothetical protein MCP1_10266 [Candidatus Terasakiella magnetica]
MRETHRALVRPQGSRGSVIPPFLAELELTWAIIPTRDMSERTTPAEHGSFRCPAHDRFHGG